MNDLRQYAHGITPLDGTLQPWMRRLLGDPERIDQLMNTYASPVNVHDFTPLEANARDMIEAGEQCGVRVRVFVARKANKTLGLVDEVKRLNLGIDVGSQRELAQVLERGMPSDRIIFTAAIKPERALRLACEARVPVALDNLDEAHMARCITRDITAAHDGDNPAPIPVVLRLAPTPSESIAPTRFGERAHVWRSYVAQHPPRNDGQRIVGLHFHLHGYAAHNRTEALGEAIALADELAAAGHPITFIDIGGGVPMRYLDSEQQWEAFWQRLRSALTGASAPLTWRADGLGLRAVARAPEESGPHGGRTHMHIEGAPDLYPYYQELVRGPWLTEVLNGQIAPGITAAQALRERAITLHCEPGRAMLDGCGITLARVVFRKHTADGVPIVGLEMNRTQCRSTSADFLVDPILVPMGSPGTEQDETSEWSGPITAYLVGAYCIEAELILKRAITFTHGVRVGDVIAFVNTGGYLMHILESASHQIPLALNVIASPTNPGEFERDDIDA